MPHNCPSKAGKRHYFSGMETTFESFISGKYAPGYSRLFRGPHLTRKRSIQRAQSTAVSPWDGGKLGKL